MSGPKRAGRSYWINGSGNPSLLEALPKEIARLTDLLEEIRKRAHAKWGAPYLSRHSSEDVVLRTLKRARRDLATWRRATRDLSEAKRVLLAVKRSAVEGS